MVPSLIMLISRSFGTSRGASQSVGKTFQRTRYHLATRNGIPKESFGYTPETPIFGSWQGATKYVVTWVVTRSIIQKTHQSTVEGAIFKSTYGQTEVNQTMLGFVDDNNNCTSRENVQGSIVEKLQESAQKREKLFHATGGMLELHKCCTYVINWEQDDEGRHQISNQIQLIEIIESQPSQTKKIQQKSPSESHKTLGCFKNPAMDAKV